METNILLANFNFLHSLYNFGWDHILVVPGSHYQLEHSMLNSLKTPFSQVIGSQYEVETLFVSFEIFLVNKLDEYTAFYSNIYTL